VQPSTGDDDDMIPWTDLIAQYRALPPFVKASLAISVVSIAA